MKKLDSRGFTLVEVIAVVVIMAVLTLVLLPNVNTLLNKGKDNSYNDLKSSIKTACKEYINDNRYNITVEGGNIVKIGSDEIDGSVIAISLLVDEGYLSPSGTDEDGDYIVDPRDKKKRMVLDDSHVKISFDGKKFTCEITDENENLKWRKED